MRRGDFSGIANTIYDPNTINSAGQRQRFAGNQIPSSRFNPVRIKLMSFYPLPNRSGVINNYFSQAGSNTTRNNVSFKIDRRISERQNLFGRFSWENADTIQAQHYHNVATSTPGVSGGRNRSATLAGVYSERRRIQPGNPQRCLA
jgi:hypothetical protein